MKIDKQKGNESCTKIRDADYDLLFFRIIKLAEKYRSEFNNNVILLYKEINQQIKI